MLLLSFNSTINLRPSGRICFNRATAKSLKLTLQDLSKNFILTVLARDSRFNIFLLLLNSGNETDEEVDRDLVEDELEVVVVTEVEGRVDRDRDPVIGVVYEGVPGVVPEVAILASGLDLVLETRKGKKNVWSVKRNVTGSDEVFHQSRKSL